MKVLVIGSGGREHALVQKISKSPAVREVLAVPGNAGIGQQATCFNLKETDFPALVRLAADNRIDLTVVGPEVPLARGIADTFQSSGLKLFGPTARAARLESSKIFAKEFMKRHGIPTADFSVADTISRALQQVEKKGYPVAIKYDGLAAGKGVRVVWNRKEAVSFLEDIFERNIFGSPGPAVVIEEALTGEEVSYLIVTDTLSYHPLAPARDYKRIFDLDQGPNTGGMGAYSPAVLLEGETARFVQEEVVHRTLKALLREGIEYRGVLYFGLMLTKKGVSVLEYNVRFGDPETQVILPRLENDLVELMEATVAGRLKEIDLRWKQEKAVCVILASKGYPGPYQTGYAIRGLNKVEDVFVYHAGTKTSENGTIVTAGGRVLGLTGLGISFSEAREKVYRAAEVIEFSGKYFRQDIAGNLK